MSCSGLYVPVMEYLPEHVRSLQIGLQKVSEILGCMNDLHPPLRALLDAELEAGNHVIDGSRDWPDPGSILITLEVPFHGEYSTAGGVVHNTDVDPHYWHADYTCGRPVHILAC